MAKIFRLHDKESIKVKGSGIDDILPFGEASRDVITKRFSNGSVTPLTEEIKMKDLDVLRRLSNE